ncbi:hypothetical protein AVEN_210183-1 [Araneus ventricosus]|uniref:Uncharacterized protein n=1 Tax=Araneus ventricosus TaxID=182803 RepID=A0A4Y2LR20_ARAVE|nr:hypothetical protein AVEN_210183-1 [Araneus ventricosus]
MAQAQNCYETQTGDGHRTDFKAPSGFRGQIFEYFYHTKFKYPFLFCIYIYILHLRANGVCNTTSSRKPTKVYESRTDNKEESLVQSDIGAPGLEFQIALRYLQTHQFCVGRRYSFSRSIFSLVILTSSFEEIRGLFWNGPLNFETWSDDKTFELALPLQTSAPHQRECVWPLHDLTCNKPITRRIFSGIGFRGWKTLTLGHRVPSFNGMMRKARSCTYTENDKTSAGCRRLPPSFAEKHQLLAVPVIYAICNPTADCTNTDFGGATFLVAPSLSFHKVIFKKIIEQ